MHTCKICLLPQLTSSVSLLTLVKMEGKERLIKYFGSVRAVADALKISSQAVSMWKSVPISRAFQIEVYTGGKLKAKDILDN